MPSGRLFAAGHAPNDAGSRYPDAVGSNGDWLGLLSTVLSSVAVIGVVYSLILQNRGLRLMQAQATRAVQMELMRMLIENPDLRSPFVTRPSVDLHSNLMLKQFEFGFIIGDYSKEVIFTQMGDLFSQESGRELWQRLRPYFIAEADTNRKRQFVALVDEEFKRSQDQRPSPE